MYRGALGIAAVVFVALIATSPLKAQNDRFTLTGTVTDSSGRPLASVSVIVRNIGTGELTNAETDATGAYKVTGLALGDYQVSASSDGMSAVAKVSLTAGSQRTLNLALTSTPASTEGTTSQQNLPNAPSSSKQPSLEDLGFPKSESQGNATEQALLDKRTHMLKIHQRMGLITTIPLLATLITSIDAGGKQTSRASRDLHVALGAATGDLYGITAYYAIRAPRVPGTETRGPIRLHKALAWVHGPGMILTPILGALAFEQKNNGEKVHGIASAHGPVAIVTAGAFGAALLSVSVKF